MISKFTKLYQFLNIKTPLFYILEADSNREVRLFSWTFLCIFILLEPLRMHLKEISEEL